MIFDAYCGEAVCTRNIIGVLERKKQCVDVIVEGSLILKFFNPFNNMSIHFLKLYINNEDWLAS